MIISPPKRKRDEKEKKNRRISNDDVVILSVQQVEHHSPGVEVLGSRTIRKPRRITPTSTVILPDLYLPRPSTQKEARIPIRTKTPPPPEPVEPAMIKCTVCLELASETTSLCATKCGHVLYC